MSTEQKDMIQIGTRCIDRKQLLSCSHGNDRFTIVMKSGMILTLAKNEAGYDEMLAKYRDAWRRSTE